MTTPIPKTQISLVCLLQLCEAININVLFPFLAFMVEYFGYSGHRLGYYAGALAGTFCGAQLVSSIFWGMMSDKYGRKPVLVIGTFGAGVGMLVFGLSESFPQAVLGRAIAGFLNGNSGVIKSFLTEITDHTNRPIGFSYLQVAWASGTIIGPLLGGFFCFPVEKYPFLFSEESIFSARPFLLPCLLIVVLNIAVAACTLMLMEEGAKIASKSSDADLNVLAKSQGEDSNDLDEFLDHEKEMIALFSTYPASTTTSSIGNTEQCVNDPEARRRNSVDQLDPTSAQDFLPSFEDETVRSMNDHNWRLADSMVSKLSNFVNKNQPYERLNLEDSQPQQQFSDIELVMLPTDIISNGVSGDSVVGDNANKICAFPEDERLSVLSDRNVLLSITCYGILCFGDIITVECIPLLCKLAIEHGGMNLTSSSIGLAISSGGLAMLIFSSVFLSKIMGGSKLRVFRIYNMASIPVVMAFPVLGTTADYIKERFTEFIAHKIIMTLLILLVTARTIVFTLSFTSVIMLVNHSVEDAYLGKVNGLGQTFASIARSVGPALGGVVWSIGLKYHFTYANFVMTVMFLLLCEYIIYQMPDSLDYKRGSEPPLDGNGEQKSMSPLVIIE